MVIISGISIEKKKNGRENRIMIIEIEENAFREINDKLGGIKSAAIQARMTTEEEMIEYLKNIVIWANEITVWLNNGVLVPGKQEVEKERRRLGLRFSVRIATGEFEVFRKLSDAQEYAAEIGSEVKDIRE